MKILVTGGCGFIGTNVCLEAKERGHEVIAFDNLVRPQTEENITILQNHGVKIVRGDIRNKVDLDKLPWYPDAIIHLAGQCGIPYSLISPLYDFEVNTVGVLNILDYARLGKIPVAFASSNKAYTNITNTLPIRETETRYMWDFSKMPKRSMLNISERGVSEQLPLDAFGEFARTPYGTSKVASDLYCQEYYQCFGVPTVVNRMSCIYGLYQKGAQDQGWVDWFIRQIVKGDGKITIFGTGKQVRDMLFGSDCAKLYLDEVENIDKVKGKAYNVGGGISNKMSLLEAISSIEVESGKKASLTFEEKRYGDQDIWYSDLAKIKEDLGWEPQISPKEGIQIMVKEISK